MQEPDDENKGRKRASSIRLSSRRCLLCHSRCGRTHVGVLHELKSFFEGHFRPVYEHCDAVLEEIASLNDATLSNLAVGILDQFEENVQEDREEKLARLIGTVAEQLGCKRRLARALSVLSDQGASALRCHKYTDAFL